MSTSWFQHNWIGTDIWFPNASTTNGVPKRWKLEHKVWENVRQLDPDSDQIQEARSVWVCSAMDLMAEEKAIVKMRMQIPPWHLRSAPSHLRSSLAMPAIHPPAQQEILALERLTQADCKSTPRLYAWKADVQREDMWVPGGFIVFILMEQVPGVSFTDRAEFWKLPGEEREEVRKGFQDAWMECAQKCRWENVEAGLRNLVWDGIASRCWIIDWEVPAEAHPNQWGDKQYQKWELVNYYNKPYSKPSEWLW